MRGFKIFPIQRNNECLRWQIQLPDLILVHGAHTVKGQNLYVSQLKIEIIHITYIHIYIHAACIRSTQKSHICLYSVLFLWILAFGFGMLHC